MLTNFITRSKGGLFVISLFKLNAGWKTYIKLLIFLPLGGIIYIYTLHQPSGLMPNANDSGDGRVGTAIFYNLTIRGSNYANGI